MNISDLGSRLSKEEVESVIAIPDMWFGNIYQSQKNFEYYTVSKAGYALKLNRFNSEWVKQRGMQFVWMMNHKWKKVNDQKVEANGK